MPAAVRESAAARSKSRGVGLRGSSVSLATRARLARSGNESRSGFVVHGRAPFGHRRGAQAL
jgi:hypothetical protein